MSKYIGFMKSKGTLDVISRIRESANAFIVDELAKGGIQGLVPSHGAILVALYRCHSMTMREIAVKINRKQPTVTILIDKLVDAGYVIKEKSIDDSRTTLVTLTKKGENFRGLFDDISGKLNKRMFKGFSKDEIAVLDALLDRVAGNW